jgi:hypothetical protein
LTDAAAAPSRTAAPRRRRPWGLAIWAISATAALLFVLVSDVYDYFAHFETGIDRAPFDFHFENALSGSRDFKQTVAGLRPGMNVVAACFYEMDRVEKFLGEKARAALEEDRYYHQYDRADYVWRIVLISDDQRYKVVYLVQYFEPGEDSSQFGCYALSEIETVVTPPSIRNGRQELGEIRLKPAGNSTQPQPPSP